MYIVVSRWEPFPGKEEEFADKGRAMRNLLRGEPGVKFLEGFKDDEGGAVAIVGYKSRADYDRIVNDPNGPFVKGAQTHKIEESAKWVRSERGEAIAD